ncbi:MAG: tRNA-dihydrouridine synthase [Ignavibacteria bacterium]|nr:tRNA-dihydrouridine synthase [Ignavibacteria bacterium]
MAKIAESVLTNVKLPVTLKTRLGWDEDSIVIVEVARILEKHRHTSAYGSLPPQKSGK